VIKRALISVWNKEGVVELGQFLQKNNVEILWGIGGKHKANSSSWILKRWNKLTS